MNRGKGESVVSEPNRHLTIRMGEMSVAAEGERLRTVLGSCVGVVLYDRTRRMGGLAHVVLPTAPDPDTDRPGKFVDTAIPRLAELIRERAGGPLRLTAKIAGGASMFAATAYSIGLRNIEVCEETLSRMRIPVLGRHCGGEQGRRMTLHADSGRVTIDIVGRETFEL